MEHKSEDAQNIVSLACYQAATQFQEIKEVEAYWQGLRGARDMPLRSEIDPRGIERALEYAFILERIAPGLARFRLSGLHLNDLLGMEVRGMPFTSLFTATARQTVSAALEAVFDGPQTAEITLKAERRIGKPPMDAKLILLPLRSDLGEVTRILGCLMTLGPIGRAPRRFDVVRANRKPVLNGQATPLVVKPKPAPKREFAETGTAYKPRPAPRPDVKHPILRLVTTDD